MLSKYTRKTNAYGYARISVQTIFCFLNRKFVLQTLQKLRTFVVFGWTCVTYVTVVANMILFFSCFCVNSLARELLGKEGKEALKSMADSKFAGVRAGVSVYCEVWSNESLPFRYRESWCGLNLNWMDSYSFVSITFPELIRIDDFYAGAKVLHERQHDGRWPEDKYSQFHFGPCPLARFHSWLKRSPTKQFWRKLCFWMWHDTFDISLSAWNNSQQRTYLEIFHTLSHILT